jgi:hypothetical protein
MLDKLQKLLNDNALLIEDSVGNIENDSFKGIKVTVINFEKIIEIFSTTLKMGNRLKCVDAIKFNNASNTLFLIEWTSYKKCSKHFKTTFECFLDKQYNYELINKAVDSIFMFLGLIGFYDIHKDFFGYFLDTQEGKNKLKVKTVLLSDVDDMELSALDLTTLEKQNISLTKRISSPIIISNSSSFSQDFNY